MFLFFFNYILVWEINNEKAIQITEEHEDREIERRRDVSMSFYEKQEPIVRNQKFDYLNHMM